MKFNFLKYRRITAMMAAAAIFLTGCSGLNSPEDLTYTGTLFDTVVHIQIYDPVDTSVLDGAVKLCRDYEQKFSRTIETSEISQINSAGGNPVAVSEDTTTLIKKGLYYAELSGGVFDITIGPVSGLWDFKAQEPALPDPGAIAQAVSHVSYKNVVVQDNTVKLTDPAAGIDVGAIAKGYIADRVKDYLKKHGVKHAMINLGGNVLTVGGKLDGSDYNIGIQKPFDEGGKPITSVKVRNKSVVTSGIYQRYFEKDGKIYHHILSPATGYPCENNLLSVTIITDSSLTADALSTTCFLLGYDQGMKLVNQLENVDAVFITDDNELHYSKNFQRKV